MRAVLLASATIVRLKPRRATSAFSQVDRRASCRASCWGNRLTTARAPPEVVVGASSDAAESWLAAGGILSRHQPDPRCHLAARAKLSAIVDGGDDRRGDNRADAGQLREPPASLIRAADGNHRRVELLDPAIEIAELVQ